MQLTLVYPNFPFWRAEVSRVALHLGGIEFENRHFTREEFRAAKADGTLPFGQVPILMVDGETIAQTGAIARFCGKLSGLYPTDDALSAAKIDQFIDACTDVTGRVGLTMGIQDPEEKMAARAALAADTLPKWLGYLEALSPPETGGFFVGDSLTIADVAVWRLMGWLTGGILDGVPATVVDPFPRLKAHAERTGAEPRIRAWMDANYG